MTDRSNISRTDAHDGAERPGACSLPRVLLYQVAFAEAGRETRGARVGDAEVRQ